jgi:hypothetical protein
MPRDAGTARITLSSAQLELLTSNLERVSGEKCEVRGRKSCHLERRFSGAVALELGI